MKTTTAKIFAQFSAGIFGGTIVGIAGFVALMYYGGNYGCFGGGGYESCGSFGATGGLIIGVIFGISILSKIPLSNYSKVAIYCLCGACILPFLYGVIMFWPPFEDGDLLVVPPVIFAFMLASTVPSAIIVGAMQSQKFFTKK